MRAFVISAVVAFSLTACVQQATKQPKIVPENAVTMRGELAREQRIANQQAFEPQSVTQHYRQTPVVTLDNYARNLVQELMTNHHNADENAMVAVTDLAFIDTDLQQGSVFTNHLSEAIIYDLHLFGVPVLDYKVTDYIRVTPQGDFVLSRDFNELSAELPIKYVVTGTATLHQAGIMLNARLIQIDSKRVISAARTFVPAAVYNAILQQHGDATLKLKQG
ncbi:FlgO family outer membrane protein [Alishewanella sp. HL-SH06]|uniref:FlgO family outer membrane protein n=1 Tax=Alishewanella sp. HL-SH06 TaxID=3461144 RepID=UPI00404387F4